MTEILTFLKQSDIFYQFTQTQLELVANLCVEKTFQAGELIFAENNSGKELYIIVQGEVNISVNPGVVLCETYPQLGYRLMYNLAADLAMKTRNADLRIREKMLYGQPK
jgi:signal-transduction protein with cAMP-binding, CBS, and nucleotidyltransferase domain